MLWYFYETKTGFCIVQEGNSEKVYVTPMMDFYKSDRGKRALLPHTKDWGMDDFEDHRVDILTSIGYLVVSEQTLSEEDKEILERVIDKEGFEYAMLHYSDYTEDVQYNHIKDVTFHNKLRALREAHNDLQFYLRDNGISGMDNYPV
ncbi:hypothetical protein MYOV085v1_p0123 [Vibrio phage 355E48.1]|nr:hypothetical protein MYOV085v1_p0123 [Vibrio phage 355E48.1]